MKHITWHIRLCSADISSSMRYAPGILGHYVCSDGRMLCECEARGDDRNTSEITHVLVKSSMSWRCLALCQA